MLGVELESSELEVTTASGLEVPLLVYLCAPLLVTKQVLLRPGPVGGWKVRKSSYMKSGRALHVELGFTNTSGCLRPLDSDCKAYLRNPFFLADHQGVQVSLLLETVLILFL